VFICGPGLKISSSPVRRSFGLWAEQGLFLFECGRPQPNLYVGLGPETNVLFLSGGSKMAESRRKTSTLSWASRIHLKLGVGIPEIKKVSPAPGTKLICGPGL
jgi:hypothetical protein